jgi:hypothetical protein
MDDVMHEGNGGIGADVSERLQNVREDLDEANRRVRDLVQERPLTCLLAALIGGYVVARLVR